MAYDLAEILSKQQSVKIEEALADLTNEQLEEPDTTEQAKKEAKAAFAVELKGKLPPYIINAIEYVTPLTNGQTQVGV